MSWTEAEKQKLHQLRTEHKTLSEIGELLGKTKKAVSKKLRRDGYGSSGHDTLTSDKFSEALKLYSETGSFTECARRLGICRSSFRHRYYKALEQYHEGPRVGPEPLPDGQREKARSTLYDDEGNRRVEWIKSEPDRDRQRQMMEEAAAEMGRKLPRLKSVSPPKSTDGELLNLYCLTDIHLGMLAWHEETRDRDWDLDTAEALMVGWIEAAIKQSPSAHTAVLGQIGDLLHWDGLLPVTPQHGNVLDADTRFAKLVRVAIRAIRRTISMLLKTHQRVHVVMATGNHDQSSAVWMREFLCSIYENEPRITIDRSPDVYYAYEWGKTALFFHHGHHRKPDDVSRVFGGLFRDLYGRTHHAYAHMGHKHEDKVVEDQLMKVEQHRTLAARDAYASQNGYLAGSDAKVITYSREHGEVSRQTISPNRVRHLVQ